MVRSAEIQPRLAGNQPTDTGSPRRCGQHRLRSTPVRETLNSLSMYRLCVVPEVLSGEVVALDGIDLDVTQGQIHGLVGPNGAGKRRCSGSCWASPAPTAAPSRSWVRRSAGYSPSLTVSPVSSTAPASTPSLTARQNLAAPAVLRGEDARSAGIDDAPAQVGLTDVADDRAATPPARGPSCPGDPAERPRSRRRGPGRAPGSAATRGAAGARPPGTRCPRCGPGRGSCPPARPRSVRRRHCLLARPRPVPLPCAARGWQWWVR